jgi:hypothetical protein
MGAHRGALVEIPLSDVPGEGREQSRIGEIGLGEG